VEGVEHTGGKCGNVSEWMLLIRSLINECQSRPPEIPIPALIACPYLSPHFWAERPQQCLAVTHWSAPCCVTLEVKSFLASHCTTDPTTYKPSIQGPPEPSPNVWPEPFVIQMRKLRPSIESVPLIPVYSSMPAAAFVSNREPQITSSHLPLK
jgi:hypothetical protein